MIKILNFLKNLFNFSYNSNVDKQSEILLQDIVEANKKLNQENVLLKINKENTDNLFKKVNSNRQVIYIDTSSDNNGIITITQNMRGNKIKGIDFYGYFDVSAINGRGDIQRIFTEFHYDSNDIAYCELIDVQCNHGYGSIMINCAMEHLKTFDVAYIRGIVSTFDSKDPYDKEHNSRLHHFYTKNGFMFFTKGRNEYLQFNLKDEKFCSREHLESESYEIEKSCYFNLTKQLIISNRLRISELSRTLRIEESSFYIYALKKDAEISPKRMLEDLSLLYDDIKSTERCENSGQKKRLTEILFSFIDPIRYHKDNIDMIAFSEQVKKELNIL